MPARGDAAVCSSRGAKSTLVKAMRPSVGDRLGVERVARTRRRGRVRWRRSCVRRRPARAGGECPARGRGEHDPPGRGVGASARGPGLDELVGLLGLGARDAEVAGELAREAERQRRHDAERDQPGGQDGPAAAHRERAKTMEKTSHSELPRSLCLQSTRLVIRNHSKEQRHVHATLHVGPASPARGGVPLDRRPKLLGDDAMTATFAELGAGQWLRYVTGTLEIAGRRAAHPVLRRARRSRADGRDGRRDPQRGLRAHGGDPVTPAILLALAADRRLAPACDDPRRAPATPLRSAPRASAQ